jgi:hypothetical protein
MIADLIGTTRELTLNLLTPIILDEKKSNAAQFEIYLVNRRYLNEQKSNLASVMMKLSLVLSSTCSDTGAVSRFLESQFRLPANKTKESIAKPSLLMAQLFWSTGMLASAVSLRKLSTMSIICTSQWSRAFRILQKARKLCDQNTSNSTVAWS